MSATITATVTTTVTMTEAPPAIQHQTSQLPPLNELLLLVAPLDTSPATCAVLQEECVSQQEDTMVIAGQADRRGRLGAKLWVRPRARLGVLGRGQGWASPQPGLGQAEAKSRESKGWSCVACAGTNARASAIVEATARAKEPITIL